MTITVIDGVCADLVDVLASEILMRSNLPSYGSRNVGGWKSTETLFDWRAVSVRLLADAINDTPAVLAITTKRRCELVGWAMVNRNGSYHQRHCHAGVLVGVYYVASGNPSVPTVFEIRADQTQAAAKREIKVERAIDAVPGRLVTFPPSMWHRVPVYNGTAPRITIAFELRALP